MEWYSTSPLDGRAKGTLNETDGVVGPWGASIPKWSPSWCHLWATDGVTSAKTVIAVGLLLRSSSLKGSVRFAPPPSPLMTDRIGTRIHVQTSKIFHWLMAILGMACILLFCQHPGWVGVYEST